MKIPDIYRKLKQTQQEVKNVTSFKTLKDKRDPLNAGYALNQEDKYRRAVRFDGGFVKN